MTARQPFWGEIHTHTALSDGNGSPEENVDIARSHLDFWAMADHVIDSEVFSAEYLVSKGKPLLPENWPRVQELCRTNEDPGHFIPILGYEWTNYQYGHHNVYYLDYDQPLRMPPTLPQLYRSLSGVDAFVIPHHTGYPVGMCGKNWDYHDEVLSPFVEIYSLHGSSEEHEGIEPILTSGSWMGPGGDGGSVQEGLARGYKLGIMASSDSHAEHPGAYDCGLIAAYADELTRTALWGAMRSRQIYGVTGDRILLDFRLNGHPMGSVLKQADTRTLDISVVGWDRIDRIDIIKNNTILHSFLESPTPPAGSVTGGPLRFMVGWGWDRSADNDWEGTLKVDGGKVLQAIPCYRGRVAARAGKGVQSLTETECRWTSHTAKYEWGHRIRKAGDIMAFEVACTPDTKFHFSVECGERTKTWPMSPERMTANAFIQYMAAVPKTNDGSTWAKLDSLANVKVYRGGWTDQLTFNLSHTDQCEAQTGTTDFYYVRVIQHNGQRAWSSPIWVER